jgi:acyl-CoA synthetase (AMP-forming)/AMP-acid ligase II
MSHAQNKVSLAQPFSIFQRFRLVVEAYRDKTAISVDGIDCDYDELFKRVTVCCDMLLKQGVEKGDAVALLLPNGLDFVVVTLATMAIEATLLPLNPKI